MKLNLIVLALFATLSSSGFAKTFELKMKGTEPLYQTQLPIAVYQYTHSNTLADLTITNAAGEQVPYDLLNYDRLNPSTKTKLDKKSLPVFTVTEANLNNTNELQVILEKEGNKTSLNVNTSDAKPNTNNVFILDAGTSGDPFDTLEVDWEGSNNKLVSYEILVSNDLKDWTSSGQGALLKTTSNGNRILQNTITLKQATNFRYLQIKPLEHMASDAFKLTSATAIYSHLEINQPIGDFQVIKFLGREASAGQTKLNYEAEGHYPANELNIRTSGRNIITIVTVATRNKTDEPWVNLTSASLYDFNKNGKSMRSRHIKIDPKVARYWQLQFNDASGGIDEVNPYLELHWLPQTMVWNARGQAPFILHVGENPSVVNTMSVASLIPDYKPEKVQALPSARLDWHAEDASPQASVAAAPANSWETPADYKRWYLWAGLLIGVSLLAGMAYSLLKSTSKK